MVGLIKHRDYYHLCQTSVRLQKARINIVSECEKLNNIQCSENENPRVNSHFTRSYPIFHLIFQKSLFPNLFLIIIYLSKSPNLCPVARIL